MTALKDIRRDLGDHLAAQLEVPHAALGSQLNPPAVVIESGFPYLDTSTYCVDKIAFRAFIVAPSGDLDAVADAIDDLTDKVRPALAKPSPLGLKYGYREVSGQTTYGDSSLPAVVVAVEIEREHR